MKVIFLTIVLDGLPFISLHYPVFRSLPFEWEWHVVEGVAAPMHCTSWCKPVKPRLSKDGTSQYLTSLSFDPRIRVYRKKKWQGKIEMVNTPLTQLRDPCLLFQLDSDEVWTADQLCAIRRLFLQSPKHTSAQFYCRYFVGPSVITSTLGTYGNRPFDWHRVWRFTPGMKFATHEPPVLLAADGSLPVDIRFSQRDTSAMGLVFDHFAYATRSVVHAKEVYYGYTDAVKGWERLQRNTKWPAALRSFFPWVKDDTQVIHL